MPNPHPYIVHFPIALFITAVICEIVLRFMSEDVDSGRHSLRSLISGTALVISAAAAFTAIIAVITGLLAGSIVPDTGKVHEVLDSHETLGFAVLAASVAYALVKVWAFMKKSDKFSMFLIAVGLLGILLIVLTANEGGELVYEYGVGVAKGAGP